MRVPMPASTATNPLPHLTKRASTRPNPSTQTRGVAQVYYSSMWVIQLSRCILGTPWEGRTAKNLPGARYCPTWTVAPLQRVRAAPTVNAIVATINTVTRTAARCAGGTALDAR